MVVHKDKLVKMKTCSLASCERTAFARSYCKQHWQRNKLKGDPQEHKPLRSIPDPCSVDGCDYDMVSRGLCKMHKNKHDQWEKSVAESIKYLESIGYSVSRVN